MGSDTDASRTVDQVLAALKIKSGVRVERIVFGGCVYVDLTLKAFHTQFLVPDGTPADSIVAQIWSSYMRLVRWDASLDFLYEGKAVFATASASGWICRRRGWRKRPTTSADATKSNQSPSPLVLHGRAASILMCLQGSAPMSLTKEQNAELAKKLHGTTSNVYNLARSMFGHEFEDGDFDRLRAEANIFRCEECSEWLDVSMEDESVSGMCSDCMDNL